MSTTGPRSSVEIALSVWRALLLREAVSRMFGQRAAMVWLLLEPAFQILVMVFVFSVIRLRHVGGMDTPVWLAAGLLSFYLFQRSAFRGAGAIEANRALFTYRQVKPVDTVLMRCVLEAMLLLLVGALTLGALGLTGVTLMAYDPLYMLGGLAGLWVLGVGCALAFSAATALVPEFGKALGLATVGLAFLSGVIFPLAAIPQPWRQWLMLNPIAHGIEAVRAGISPYYHHVPELNLGYLMFAALFALVVGLALQVRYERKVVAL